VRREKSLQTHTPTQRKISSRGAGKLSRRHYHEERTRPFSYEETGGITRQKRIHSFLATGSCKRRSDANASKENPLSVPEEGHLTQKETPRSLLVTTTQRYSDREYYPFPLGWVTQGTGKCYSRKGTPIRRGQMRQRRDGRRRWNALRERQ